VIVTASAPGKIVVAGEYAVLADAPALVLAVERRMRVALRAGARDWRFASRGFTGSSRHRLEDLLTGPALPRSDPAALAQYALRALAAAGHPLDVAPRDLDVEIDSSAGYEAAAKLGLGSSAAVCVALCAALLALIGAPTSAALAAALTAHHRAQGGRGSGLDVAAAYEGGLIRFANGGRTLVRLRWPPGVHWLPIRTRTSADTADSVARFDAWRAAGEPAALTDLKRAAHAVADAVGDAVAFMRELRRYAERLAAFDAAAGLGIATVAHERLRALAGTAVVYKPCGAGGGDMGLACAEDAAALAAFGRAAAEAGYPPLDMEIARHGVDVSITR
jgi:phosphomevalonate kinase